MKHNKWSPFPLSPCFAYILINSLSSEFPPNCITYNIIKQIVSLILNNKADFFFFLREAVQVLVNILYNTF